MIYSGTLYRAELYDKHTAPYTSCKEVYEANKDRYKDKYLVVSNAHWYDSGPKAVGNYKVSGTVISKEWNSAIGFLWSGNEQPIMGWSNMTSKDNFICTIPVLMNSKKLDYSGQTSGVKRSCFRTWFGFNKDNECTIEITTTNYTLDEIVDRMISLGIVNGIVLDGSGSSQCYDGKTLQTGDNRTIYSYLLLWFDKGTTNMTYHKTIDVSENNGKIDWEKVKNYGIEYAVIRAGYGKNNIDKTFIYNISECNRLWSKCFNSPFC